MNRVIEIKDLAQAKRELAAIGSQDAGIELMAPKAVQRVIKLTQIRSVAANIIKQEILSYGGEAATAYGAVNLSAEKTDLLIIGTIKQLGLLVAKLKQHQFGLPVIAREIERLLANYDLTFDLLGLGRRTLVMGILNVTPDSFSDGGKFLDVKSAVAQAKQMIADGADIIDVGGESSRPGAKAVSAQEEISRVFPVIEQLSAETKVLISVDTTKAEVAKKAITAGAKMVNDISALRADSDMAKVVANNNLPVCLMHIKGTPQNMQDKPEYSDLMGEIIGYLAEGLAIAKRAGILISNLIVDPGIGFGKTVAHNLEILDKLKELKVLGCPILVGPSRKSFIGQTLDLPVEDRLEGTLAAVTIAIANGADIIRVHDVKESRRVVRLTDAIINKGGGKR
ncbi:MAG: dihydropteroate synthase [bacterium]